MFKNVALIINYNHSKHIPETVHALKNLYQDYFKDIFIYADSKDLVVEIPGLVIHYMDQFHGAYSAGVISDFASRYDIHKYDGVFFTMDDCLINVSLLDALDDQKTIYDYLRAGTPGPISEKSGWHWDVVVDKGHKQWGIGACTNVLKDPRFIALGGKDIFVPSSGDFLYVPLKYIDRYVEFSRIFYDHRVFLEIAVSSCLAQIPALDDHNIIDHRILWKKEERENVTIDYINERIKTVLIFHPVKLSKNRMRYNKEIGLMEGF